MATNDQELGDWLPVGKVEEDSHSTDFISTDDESTGQRARHCKNKKIAQVELNIEKIISKNKRSVKLNVDENHLFITCTVNQCLNYDVCPTTSTQFLCSVVKCPWRNIWLTINHPQRLLLSKILCQVGLVQN